MTARRDTSGGCVRRAAAGLRAAALAICAAVLLSTPACIIQNNNPPAPTTITVELVNTTTFVIDANFFRSGTALDASGLFVRDNIYTGYSSAPIPTLNALQTVSFELPCTEAASLGVRRPVFANPVTLSGGESPDELFLRRDVNFSCGQRIRFTYTAQAPDFHVDVAVQSQ